MTAHRAPWVLIAGGFHQTGGMDKANAALATYLVQQQIPVHLVAHRVDEALAAHPDVSVHLVPRPMDSYFLGERALELRGTAVARFRATGPVGAHEIKVYTGYMGQSYLNHEQAPNAYLPRPRFVFHVTPGAVVAGGFVEPYQPQKVPAADIRTAAQR